MEKKDKYSSFSSTNYSTFLSQCLLPLLSENPLTPEEKLFIEYLLITDSYLFIENSLHLLKIKLENSYQKLLRLIKDFEDTESSLEQKDKLKVKYLQMYRFGRIYGLLMSLQLFNNEKYRTGDEIPLIDFVICHNKKISWTNFAILDSVLVYNRSASYVSYVSSFLQNWTEDIELILYRSVSAKIGLSDTNSKPVKVLPLFLSEVIEQFHCFFPNGGPKPSTVPIEEEVEKKIIRPTNVAFITVTTLQHINHYY